MALRRACFGAILSCPCSIYNLGLGEGAPQLASFKEILTRVLNGTSKGVIGISPEAYINVGRTMGFKLIGLAGIRLNLLWGKAESSETQPAKRTSKVAQICCWALQK